MAGSAKIEGPDLSAGVAAATIADGATLVGHVGDDPVLLSRRGGEYFAVSAACTHYGGPLAEGLIDGDRVHCPWHHACFSLRSGEALAAPAFDALKRWRVDVEDGRLHVREPLAAADVKARISTDAPKRILIAGGGAAAFAAAEMLRRKGFAGELTLFSADKAPPVDRPNLSKDYLAGTAPPEWIPLKSEDFYRDNGIDLRLGVTIASIDRKERSLITSDGRTHGYDRLLLATGASPIRLKGFEHAKAYVLRSLSDADAIISEVTQARRAVIVGAGFIGLETAASLRSRGLEVDVVTPDAAPLLKIVGPEVAAFVRALHEKHGVRFHLGESAEGFDGEAVRLSSGARLAAEIVILGVGARPNTELASKAGLKVSNGVEVDLRLRTSDPDIFAAGDIAAFPDPLTGERARIEHWVAAERQGQIAALNMLGGQERYDDAPFFWSAHYDQSLRYVGHAAGWNKVEIDGSVANGDFTARYYRDRRLLAAASLNRDRENLEIERELNIARRAIA